MHRLATFVLLLVLALSSFAATKTWDGSASTLWGNASNWAENATPGPGDDLLFPPGASNLNNLSDIGSFSYASLTVSGDGYTLNGTGNGSGFGLNTPGGVTISGMTTLNVSITLNVDQTWNIDDTLVSTKVISLFGNDLTVDINDASWSHSGGIANGQNGGSITFIGNGNILLNGSPHSTSTQPMTVNGPLVAIVDDTFTGSFTQSSGHSGVASNGILGAVTITGGTFEPGLQGTGNGKTGPIALAPAATFRERIDGTTTTQFGNLAVTGNVTLGGATLDLATTGIYPGGTHFTIIANDGADPVTGTFAGLANGATFSGPNQQWSISYNAGTGNDVVLTAIGPGGAAATTTVPTLNDTMLGAFALLLGVIAIMVMRRG